MGRTVGIKIETFHSAGRYQHRVYDIGVNARNRHDVALPDGVVEALKRANELAYEAMPNGSRGLVSIVKYSRPRGK